MNKKYGLRKNTEFRHVYDKGKSYANKYIVMFFIENGLDFNRVGFATTKKVGNSVVRSKIKRRMKESYRLNSTKFKQGYDIIFLSRASAKDTTYREVESAILHLGKISKLSIKEK